ncbi:beta/alpha barrel domain-containing protein [Staphylococcus warneri]|nr:hypothetical protein [Staphylococcus warneri]
MNTIEFDGKEGIEMIKWSRREYGNIKIFKGLGGDEDLVDEIEY